MVSVASQWSIVDLRSRPFLLALLHILCYINPLPVHFCGFGLYSFPPNYSTVVFLVAQLQLLHIWRKSVFLFMQLRLYVAWPPKAVLMLSSDFHARQCTCTFCSHKILSVCLFIAEQKSDYEIQPLSYPVICIQPCVVIFLELAVQHNIVFDNVINYFFRWLFEWINANGYKTKIVPFKEWVQR